MKKSILNIIFYVLVIVLLCITVKLNKDYSVIKNRVIINNKESMNSYKDYKFVTLDLSKSKETRFAINDKNKVKSIIYTVRYGKKDYLIELLPSTVTTSKVNLMKMEDNDDISLLKGDLATESDNKLDFGADYYTNVNIKDNEKIINIKYIFTKVLLCVCLGMISIHLIKLLVSILFKKSRV